MGLLRFISPVCNRNGNSYSIILLKYRRTVVLMKQYKWYFYIIFINLFKFELYSVTNVLCICSFEARKKYENQGYRISHQWDDVAHSLLFLDIPKWSDRMIRFQSVISTTISPIYFPTWLTFFCSLLLYNGGNKSRISGQYIRSKRRFMTREIFNLSLNNLI